MEKTPAINCQAVGMHFGALHVLQHVNLTVASGEIVTLVGESGSGKSTLLRIIGGLLDATAGQVTVLGQTSDAARRGRGYGIVFQSPTLYGWRTVEENVALPLEIIGLARAERQARVQSALELVRLTEFSKSYPYQLSGGMQQRVSLARALAYRPPLLLMDEPFAALDALTRERLTQELLTIHGQTGLTIFFVTHDIADAVFLSHRVAVLSPRPGTIRAEIPIDLPAPRGPHTREDPAFLSYMAQVRARLVGG